MRLPSLAALTALALMAVSAPVLRSFAGGGSDISGGGNGVVCFRDAATAEGIVRSGTRILPDDAIGEIVSIEALELREAREAGAGIDPIFSAVHEGEAMPFEAVLNLLMERLSWASPELMMDARKLSFDIHDEAIVRQPHGLIPVDDMGPVRALPDPRCVIVTMAAHFHAQEETFIHLDARLYDHPSHSTLSRATLALHELLYSSARRRGHTDSSGVRAVLSRIVRQDPREGLLDAIRTSRLAPGRGYSAEIADFLARSFADGTSQYLFLYEEPETERLRDWLRTLYLEAFYFNRSNPLALRCDGSALDTHVREIWIPALAERAVALAASATGELTAEALVARLVDAQSDLVAQARSLGPEVWTEPAHERVCRSQTLEEMFEAALKRPLSGSPR